MVNQSIKKIYLIGIKGTGLSSLAVLLKKMGYVVSGSDTAETFFTESQLKSNHISYHNGFSTDHINTRSDLVIYSTAYGDSNLEILQAKKLRIPLLSYPEAIGWISQNLISVAVCGSHGKTTTTSMLAWIMQYNDRTAALVGTVADLNKKIKDPTHFVFEADEYQDKLQHYNPLHVILTNIDYDHPDFFKTEKQYTETFHRFATRILKQKGFILYNHDDKATQDTLKKLKGDLRSYGFSSEAGFQVIPTKNLDGFSVTVRSKKLLSISLSVYGRHNILNAAAAAIMALRLNVPTNIIKQRLKTFTGIKRRMEIIPSKNYLLIDDYGHHPTEIRATLSALRHHYPKHTIVAVFHPHTFTRTKTLLKEFGRSFSDVDRVIVLDIYASAREKAGGVHATDLVKEIKKDGVVAIHCPTIPEAAEYIKKNIPKKSLILTIGAGDVWKLCDLLK